jgi:hypothetical protein
MDADERIEFDFSLLENLGDTVDAVFMKLFDFYITEEDVHLSYKDRKWMGPEYRSIGMIFRMGSATGWHINDQRICSTSRNNFKHVGFVKHYGKAVSIEEWEKTCDYYSTYFPEPYKTKWKNRKGKAIHTKSDFNRPLIKWEDRNNNNIIIKIG